MLRWVHSELKIGPNIHIGPSIVQRGDGLITECLSFLRISELLDMAPGDIKIVEDEGPIVLPILLRATKTVTELEGAPDPYGGILQFDVFPEPCVALYNCVGVHLIPGMRYSLLRFDEHLRWSRNEPRSRTISQPKSSTRIRLGRAGKLHFSHLPLLGRNSTMGPMSAIYIPFVYMARLGVLFRPRGGGIDSAKCLKKSIGGVSPFAWKFPFREPVISTMGHASRLLAGLWP